MKLKNRQLHLMLGFFACMMMILSFVAPTNAEGNVHYLRPYYLVCSNSYSGNPKEYFTMNGITYTYGFTSSKTYGESEAYYKLDGISTVTFIVGHVDEYKNDSAENVFYAYLDGVKVKEIILTPSMTPQIVTLNTEGKKQLELYIGDEYAAFSSRYNAYGVADITYTGTKHNNELEHIIDATVFDDGYMKYKCTDCGNIETKTLAKRPYCDNTIMPFASKNFTVYNEPLESDKYVKVMGVKYFKALATDNTSSIATAEYNLDKLYSTFSFTIGHNDFRYWRNGTLSVLVDDRLIKTIDCSYNMIEQTYDIDVNGSDKLTFSFESNYDISYSCGYVIFNINATPVDNKKMSHSYAEEVVIEPQFATEGLTKYICKNCGAYYTKKTPALKRNLADVNISYALSKTAYSYNGKAKKPDITIKYDNEVLTKNKDYTITYKNNKNPGTAKVVVTGKGNYNGSLTVKFKINKMTQKITTKKSSYSLKKGKSLSLGAKAKGTLTYKSSDTKIATVTNKGKIKAKKKGTCVITITAKATSAYKKATKKITIKVK